MVSLVRWVIDYWRQFHIQYIQLSQCYFIDNDLGASLFEWIDGYELSMRCNRIMFGWTWKGERAIIFLSNECWWKIQYENFLRCIFYVWMKYSVPFDLTLKWHKKKTAFKMEISSDLCQLTFSCLSINIVRKFTFNLYRCRDFNRHELVLCTSKIIWFFSCFVGCVPKTVKKQSKSFLWVSQRKYSSCTHTKCYLNVIHFFVCLLKF